jgi:hypothetical protein
MDGAYDDDGWIESTVWDKTSLTPRVLLSKEHFAF